MFNILLRSILVINISIYIHNGIVENYRYALKLVFDNLQWHFSSVQITQQYCILYT